MVTCFTAARLTIFCKNQSMQGTRVSQTQRTRDMAHSQRHTRDITCTMFRSSLVSHTRPPYQEYSQTHPIFILIGQLRAGFRVKGRKLCAQQFTFKLVVLFAGLINSVQGEPYTCKSHADCQYPTCNNNPCSGFGNYASCNNGLWDARCVSTTCDQYSNICFPLARFCVSIFLQYTWYRWRKDSQPFLLLCETWQKNGPNLEKEPLTPIHI